VAIAAAKAGIMKVGRPVVVAPQPHPTALAGLREHADALGCQFWQAGGEVRRLGGPRLAEGGVRQDVEIVPEAGEGPPLTGETPSLVWMCVGVCVRLPSPSVSLSLSLSLSLCVCVCVYVCVSVYGMCVYVCVSTCACMFVFMWRASDVRACDVCEGVGGFSLWVLPCTRH
jgi:hypothetical protein